MEHTLTRRERIRRRPEFLRVQRQGVREQGRHLTLFILPNGLDITRLGVIATRRLGGSTHRNRSKRLARELFRQNKGRPGFDIVALLRPGFSDASFNALEIDYRSVLQRGTVAR